MSGTTTTPSVGGQGTQAAPQSQGYRGSNWFQSGGDLLNGIQFMMDRVLAGRTHAALVKVMSVTAGSLSKPAMVAVQPMVNQQDGNGNKTEHGTIYNIPCFRYQAGVCGFLVDPVDGDIGLAVMCDRDSSSVKETGAVANPGSRRQNDWADGMYFGGFLNGTVSTYIQLTQDGKVTIVAPGGVFVTGNIETTGTLKNNNVNVGSTHVHGGVSTGIANTAVPH